MIPKLLSGFFLLLALGAPAAPLLLQASGPVTEAIPEVSASAEVGEPAGLPGEFTLLSLARARTPFRPGGLPARVRYGDAPPTPPPPRAVVERPRLLLSGILWGRQPLAVIEGIPGVEQAVALAEGGAAGGFQVTRIERERVIVAGQGTVWTLTVRNPWP